MPFFSIQRRNDAKITDTINPKLLVITELCIILLLKIVNIEYFANSIPAVYHSILAPNK